jgi:hypothetical protein
MPIFKSIISESIKHVLEYHNKQMIGDKEFKRVNTSIIHTIDYEKESNQYVEHILSLLTLLPNVKEASFVKADVSTKSESFYLYFNIVFNEFYSEKYDDYFDLDFKIRFAMHDNTNRVNEYTYEILFNNLDKIINSNSIDSEGYANLDFNKFKSFINKSFFELKWDKFLEYAHKQFEHNEY